MDTTEEENDLAQAMRNFQDDSTAEADAAAQSAPEPIGDHDARTDAGADQGAAADGDQLSETARLQLELETLRASLSAAQDAAKADHEQMVRAVAEAMNMKKRAEADLEREKKFGNEGLLKALLPVVDSLDLALQHTDRSNPALKAVYEGVENTLTLFLKELERFGVRRTDPVGEPFDPNLHQAISMVPSADVSPNHVLQVMQKGFLLHDRVVRPAMVIVAKAPEQSRPAAPEADAESPSQIVDLEA